MVVGTSGCGKTTFARELGGVPGSHAVELDELYWAPGWIAKPKDAFVRLVDEATAGERWIVDGNYSEVTELVWRRATAVVWLNRFARVFWRVSMRTLRRSRSGESLFSGNRESLRRALLSRESILLWVLTTYRRRREYADLRADGRYPNLRWIELRRPRDVAAFFAAIRRAEATT